MKKKKPISNKVSIEFDERHLSTLTTALEVYSRLRSGQIKFAMDAAFWDKGLTYNDGEVIESFVRTVVFHKDDELMKNRNAYYGVGQEKLRDGTVAWEIKKTIEQYQHYKRNNGIRKICDVSGDGAIQFSDIPIPKIKGDHNGYWSPMMVFRIPQRNQASIEKAMKEKNFEQVWKIVDRSFKKEPLPKGSTTKVSEVAGSYYVVVEEPYKLE
jgi:hypothetical protein